VVLKFPPVSSSKDGFNAKAAQVKPDEIADLSLCKKFEDSGFSEAYTEPKESSVTNTPKFRVRVDLKPET
jgi:hypothetical protein